MVTKKHLREQRREATALMTNDNDDDNNNDTDDDNNNDTDDNDNMMTKKHLREQRREATAAVTKGRENPPPKPKAAMLHT